MSSLADIRPGQVLGRYEFLAPIAQGGMASVWAARQWGSRGFSKIVAVKTMLPTISDDPRFERMFLDEARIASKIRHNHVVEILDLGEQDALLYLVMEWVDGESLSTIRRAAAEHGGVPLAIGVRVIADVCAGLHAAHELHDDEGQPFGLVHRDVSPQNILVGYDGVAKVLDFGVAKVAGRASDTTGIGHARGKPPYMAPEQALGHAIDRRADIFSLGIVLYQLVAERHPFRGENDIATLHNIISEQPVVSPRAFLPHLPEGLDQLILRALERDPARRFQSAREMELALEALLDGELGRVRTEEIGRLVSVWLGPRGKDRRHALREAIRRADSAEVTKVDYSGTGLSSSPVAIDPPNESGGAWTPPREISSAPRQRRFVTGSETHAKDSGEKLQNPVALGVKWHGASEPSEARDSDSTLLDMEPKWQGQESRSNGDAAVPPLRVRRPSTVLRVVLIAALAACSGAVFAWSSLAIQRQHRGGSHPSVMSPDSSAHSHSASESASESAALPLSITEIAPSASIGHSAKPEGKAVRDVRPSQSTSRRHLTGPDYRLPPIPSPGF